MCSRGDLLQRSCASVVRDCLGSVVSALFMVGACVFRRGWMGVSVR